MQQPMYSFLLLGRYCFRNGVIPLMSVLNPLTKDSLSASSAHIVGLIIVFSLITMLIVKEFAELVPEQSLKRRCSQMLVEHVCTGLFPLLMVFALIVLSKLINALFPN